MDTAKLLELLRLLRPHDAYGVAKVRLGSQNDGGYVLLDDFVGIETVIGCGVGYDVSFERDLANKGIVAHLYDHTVERLPEEHANFHFYRQRLSAQPAADAVTLQQIAAATHARPGRSLLKIDIEGDEWAAFAQLDAATFNGYRQIVAELHHLGERWDAAWLDQAERALRNVLQHFAVVHVHGNNCGALMPFVGSTVCGALEVTFANRRHYAVAPSSLDFPTALDQPCSAALPEVQLGRFVF